MKKDKKEKKTITKKMIRKKKRPDGLRMKTVLGYTFTDFMDAVIYGFKLGGFVDDIFRCCDFSAIMQPGGNV